MPYPNKFALKPLLLTGVDLGARGNAAVSRMSRHGLIPFAGLTTDLLSQVQTLSREPKIQEYCPNDAHRMGSVALADAWVGKDGGRGFVGIGREGGAQGLRLLAYGWTGFLENKHIKGANTTSSYRSGEEASLLAKELRSTVDPSFSMGLCIGELVLSTAVCLYGADPDKIALETWGSNFPALALYDALGFVQDPDVPNVPGERPTLKPVDTNINGHIVRVNPEDPTEHIVADERCHYVLRGYTV